MSSIIQSDQRERRRAVGIAKLGEETKRGFKEEGLNKMVLWAADVGTGIRHLMPHRVESWSFPLVCPSGGATPGRAGEEAFECSSPVQLQVWGRLGCRISGFCPWCPISPWSALLFPGLAGELPFVAAAVGGSRNPTKPV